MNLFRSSSVKSVSAILAGFEKTVAELIAVQSHHVAEMARHDEVISKAASDRLASELEHSHAVEVAKKIKSLISPGPAEVTWANPPV